jgi:hypothetical protein
VAALHTTVNMVVVLAVVVVATEATTRTVATARGTKHCPTVVDATIPVPATLKAPAKVPATCSGKSEVPATKLGAAILPGNKSCERKCKFWQLQESHPSFLTFLCFLRGLRSFVRASTDNVERN